MLTFRFQYLAAQTPEEQQNIANEARGRRFSYYFNAVKTGKIHPEKQDKLSREQEWKFIAQETEKMWMEQRWPGYRPAIIRMVERYLGYMPHDLTKAQTDKGYRKARRIAYYIGGVDFLKYLSERNEIPEKSIEIMNDISQLDIFGANKQEYMQRVNANLNKLKHQNQPLTPEIVSHIYKAEGLKLALKGIDSDILLEQPNIVTACYNKIKNEFSSSINAEKLNQTTLSKENPVGLFQSEETPPELISQFYTYKDIDLSSLIPDFSSPNTFLSTPKKFTFPHDMFLTLELDNLRKMSVDTATSHPPAPPINNNTPRRSEKITIKAPDFSQPILTAATPEQLEEIYGSIREYNNIPKVMRECNIAAQKAYLDNLKQK